MVKKYMEGEVWVTRSAMNSENDRVLTWGFVFQGTISLAYNNPPFLPYELFSLHQISLTFPPCCPSCPLRDSLGVRQLIWFFLWAHSLSQNLQEFHTLSVLSYISLQLFNELKSEREVWIQKNWWATNESHPLNLRVVLGSANFCKTSISVFV